MGHYINKCPNKKNNKGERRKNIFQEDDDDDESVRDYVGEEGATLMMKRNSFKHPC